MNDRIRTLTDDELLNVVGGVGELVEETGYIEPSPISSGLNLGNGLAEENISVSTPDTVKCYSCKQTVEQYKRNGRKRKTCPLCGGAIYKMKS